MGKVSCSQMAAQLLAFLGCSEVPPHCRQIDHFPLPPRLASHPGCTDVALQAAAAALLLLTCAAAAGLFCC